MGLTYPALADLDTTRLAALKELLQGIVSEYNPTIDLRLGTVNDLAIHPRALLAAASENAVNKAILATSLSEIAKNPAIADSTGIDRVLGNYRLVRKAGAKATGSISIVVSKLAPLVIPTGTVFTISSVNFVSNGSFSAKTTEGQVLSSNDRLMTASGSNFVFTIDAIAVSVGSTGNVKLGATATPANDPANFVRAYASTDFAGGENAETNTALMARWNTGLATRAWSSRPSISAVMLDQSTFAGIKAVSVIGLGDPEMLRDQHSIFPVSSGCRADMYVKTLPTYQTVTLTKTATLVSKVGATGTWQFGLLKTDAPGFYEITKVLLPSALLTDTGFAITSDTRSLDLSGSGWKPDLSTAVEGVYSAYQAGVFRFADTTTNATSLTVGVATKDYTVVVRRMPLIGDLQTFWNDADRRPPMGDVLVKAAIPCFTTVTLTVHVLPTATATAASIATLLADAINGLGFTGQLAASYLNQVLHNSVTGLVSVSGVSMSGRVRKPNAATSTLSGTALLTVSTDYANMVSGDTVAFLTTADAITVTLVVDS